MSIADKYNRGSKRKYCNIKELYAVGGHDKIYVVKGMRIYPEGKYGPYSIISVEGSEVTMPSFMLSTCEDMLKDSEVLRAIEARTLGFKIRQYQSKDNQTRYAIDWVDL